jgi:hypothetical protein
MTRAKLPLQPAYLASAIDAARDEVMKVVMYKMPTANTRSRRR